MPNALQKSPPGLKIRIDRSPKRSASEDASKLISPPCSSQLPSLLVGYPSGRLSLQEDGKKEMVAIALSWKEMTH